MPANTILRCTGRQPARSIVQPRLRCRVAAGEASSQMPHQPTIPHLSHSGQAIQITFVAPCAPPGRSVHGQRGVGRPSDGRRTSNIDGPELAVGNAGFDVTSVMSCQEATEWLEICRPTMLSRT